MDKVVIYTSYLYKIGGIETWVYNFCDLMKDRYDITLVTKSFPKENRSKLDVKILESADPKIDCDTLIMLRIMDEVPRGITYKKLVRTCHACRVQPNWYILNDYDYLVHVSKASKKSFETKGKVIHNMLKKSEKEALMIVSATRIPAPDKGKNAERILKLAKMLNDKNIPFIWFNFSDNALVNPPKNFFNVGTTDDIQAYIKKADYLVQLSDAEGFCYSILEALINGTAVICTPFETTKEIGVKDGVNGYIIPFDMDFDVTKLLNVPNFDYEWDNTPLIEEWAAILDKKPKPKKKSKEVEIKATRDYYDTELKQSVRMGQTVSVRPERAEKIIRMGYGEKI
jgi:glycosyltransferase involved in cell wall biosynthesis